MKKYLFLVAIFLSSHVINAMESQTPSQTPEHCAAKRTGSVQLPYPPKSARNLLATFESVSDSECRVSDIKCYEKLVFDDRGLPHDEDQLLPKQTLVQKAKPRTTKKVSTGKSPASKSYDNMLLLEGVDFDDETIYKSLDRLLAVLST